MRLKRVIKVVLPLGLLLLLGPQEPFSPFSAWISPWTQVTGTNIGLIQQPARNAGNAAPPLDANNIYSELPDRAAALWVPSGKDGVGPLHAIDALSSNDIWAVGETLSWPSKALVAHWDGTQWSTVHTFEVGGGGGPGYWPDQSSNPGTKLYDVVALEPDDVWAVGEHPTWVDVPMGSICCWVSRILIAHWDGKSWQIVPSPQVESDTKTPTWWGGYPLPPEHDGAYGSLNAVTAVAKDDVWAVGYSPDKRTLILHWDGTRWNAVAGPDTLKDKNYSLSDIAATSAQDIWAAGGDTIIHWDGRTWSESYRLESQDFVHPGFQSIAALSHNDVWIVGSSHWSGALEHSRLLILHWNGIAWSEISASLYCDDLRRGCNLTSIYAVSKSDIWAVGEGLDEPLIMHWNGKTWAIHNCPIKGLSSAERIGPFSDVVVTAPDEVWAVGGALKESSPADSSTGFVIRPGVGACPATPTPAPPLWPISHDPPADPVPPTLAPPGYLSNVYVPLTSVPRDKYLPPPVFEQNVAPTPVQIQPGPVLTGVPEPVPSSDAPGVPVLTPSRVASARPLP